MTAKAATLPIDQVPVTNSAWQRILDRIRRRERALPKAGPTGDELVQRITDGNRFIQRNTPPEPSSIAFLRALHCTYLAEAIYRAHTCSDHAQLRDLSSYERRRYHQLAEDVLVMLRELQP